LHNRKLVTAQSAHRVAVANALAQAAGHFFQQIIADRMTEGVIDVFEIVEIEAEYGDLLVARHPAEGVLQLFPEQCAVRQIGQCVMARHVHDLRLSFPPFGNVLDGRNPTASLHRLLDHAERTPGRCLYDSAVGSAFADLRDHARAKLLGVAGKFS
jgi:hypothetical protein